MAHEVENNFDPILLRIAHHSIQPRDPISGVVDIASSAIQKLKENSIRTRVRVDATEAPHTSDLQLRILDLAEGLFEVFV